MKIISRIIITVLAFSLAACDLESTIQEHVPQETVIVNLDAIAKALGKDEEIKELSEKNNNKLADRLRAYAEKLKSEIETEKSKLPPNKITSQQKERIQRQTATASKELQKAQSITRQQSQDYQNTLIKEFREKVQVTAKIIAAEHKAKIIITASVNVLWYDPSIDITDEVIAEMRNINKASK